MKIKYLFVVAVLGSILACNTNNSDQNIDTETVHQHEQHQLHEQKEELKDAATDSLSKLSLNNGEKWQANTETSEGIEHMQVAVESYQQQPDSMGVDSLQMTLFSEFRTLVNKCTMKGEAHEQLHYYILPLKKKMDSLKQGDVDKNVQEIENYLSSYWDYFE